MPRKPIKQRKMRVDLTDDQIHHLLHGWMLDDMHHPYFKENSDLQFPFRDDEMRRDLYFKHKDYLHSLAGKRIDRLFAQLPAGEKPKAFYDYEGNQLLTQKEEK